jgi:flavorubredoxin
VVDACPQAEIVCNKKCHDALARHMDVSNWRFKIIRDGDTISLGKRNLTFINTPMAHWPESMFTYVPEEKVLFSMDAFGQHFASSNRFDDETPLDVVLHEAKTYYANILTPYGKQATKAMARVADLEIDLVAPSHGIIWRSYLGKVLELYQQWTVCKPNPKVLVIYDTMWESTEKMAQAILDGAQSADDVEVQLFNIRRSHLTIMATAILDAATIAFGSPTLNRCMMPEMSALLTYLKGLRPANKAALAFGSYGWAKAGAKDVDACLREMKFEILSEPIQAQFKPTPEILEECRQAGRLLADKALAMTAG